MRTILPVSVDPRAQMKMRGWQFPLMSSFEVDWDDARISKPAESATMATSDPDSTGAAATMLASSITRKEVLILKMGA